MAGLRGAYSYECNFFYKTKGSTSNFHNSNPRRAEFFSNFPMLLSVAVELSQGSHLQESQGGLCSTCQQYRPITVHNKAPPEQQWAAGSFRGYWRHSILQCNGLPVSECEREDLHLLCLSEGTSINHSRIASPCNRSLRSLPSQCSAGWNVMIVLIEERQKKIKKTTHTQLRISCPGGEGQIK